MWNDTEIPLAVFFTFRSYGTWLHGDERGSVDRRNNIYGTPRIPKHDKLHNLSEIEMKYGTVTLNAAQRKSTERAIRDTCEKRRWDLVAINVRTNPVHAVIDIGGGDS